MNAELVYLETRVRDLRAKIQLRESQRDLPTEGNVHGRAEQFIASLRSELRGACANLVTLKYDPVQVVERMEAPPPAAQTIERAPSPEEVKAAVRALLSQVPDDATVSSLKELLQ